MNKKLFCLIVLGTMAFAPLVGCSSQPNETNQNATSSASSAPNKPARQANVMAAPPGMRTGLQGGRQ